MNLNRQLPGNRKSIFIIAEIGTSHNGDLIKAKSLIHAARDAGADCVKFQYVIAEEIVHPNTGEVALPGGSIPLFDKFKELERPPDFYEHLKLESEKSGLMFLCTPFGIKSAEVLKKMDVKAIKIASPELNHYPLLDSVRDLPVILSTGVSTLSDIDKALSHCSTETAILHCITAYPAPVIEYNLRVIPNLRNIFNKPVGISDHSCDPVLIPSLSAAMKVYAIEKHITLSNSDSGLDDQIALTPENFSLMCKNVRKAEKNGYNETLSEMIYKFGAEIVFKSLGNGEKKLSSSELSSYKTTNRSIMAIKDIEKGSSFTLGNIALLRSEKSLRPGLPPDFLTIILNKQAKRFIRSGSGITGDCF